MVIAVSNRVLKARRGERFFSPTGFFNRAGGRLDSRRRTAAAVLGPLPPNRRRPGADPGPLAGFLSVRGLEVVAIDDGAFDHRQVGRVVLEL